MTCPGRRYDDVIDMDEDYGLPMYVQQSVSARRWRAGRTVALGDLLVESGRVVECTTAGDSGSTAPYWLGLMDIGQTVSDGSAVWTYIAASGGAQPDDVLTARDLTGKAVKAWIWDAEDTELFALTTTPTAGGSAVIVGTSETVPADIRARAPGTGTRVDVEITEADLQALPDAVRAQARWTYKVRLSDSADDDDGEVLVWGDLLISDNARPRT